MTSTTRLACWALLTAAPLCTLAADAGTDGGQAAGRVLNGHIFMPSFTTRGALVTTSFLSGLDVGVGKTTGTFTAGSTTFSGDFEYAGVGAVIGYEYAFTRDLSARFGITESIYSGITGRSVIVVGTQLQGGAVIGATYSRQLGDNLRLGVLFDASFAPNFGLTIGNAIKGVIDACNAGDCSVDSGKALDQANATTLQPAIAVNWAPTQALGVTGNVAYQWVSQTVNDKDVTGQAMVLSGALDYDFLKISRVPIGLQAQFSWLAPSGDGLQHVTDLGGGIFYTGRQHLALGFQLINRRFAVTPDVDVSWKTYLGRFSIQYFW